MDDNRLEEGHQHKQKGWEHICTVFVLVAEYLAVRYSIVWLGWSAGLFLWFGIRSYARHYLKPRFAKAAILAAIPVIIAGTYYLTKEPKKTDIGTAQAQTTPGPAPQQPQLSSSSTTPAAKTKAKQSATATVKGNNNTTGAVNQEGGNNTAVIGNNNNIVVGSSTDPETVMELRSHCEQVSTSIGAFLWQVAPVDENQATWYEFKQRFGKDIETIANNLAARGLKSMKTPLTLILRLNAQGNMHKIIARMRDSLIFQCGLLPTAKYGNIPKAVIVNDISATAAEMTKVSDDSASRWQRPNGLIDTEEKRLEQYSLLFKFEECCRQRVIDLRGVVFERLGPGASNEDEIRSFEETMDPQQDAVYIAISDYAAKFQQLGQSLLNHP